MDAYIYDNKNVWNNYLRFYLEKLRKWEKPKSKMNSRKDIIKMRGEGTAIKKEKKRKTGEKE